jgi:hypothetical protein
MKPNINVTLGRSHTPEGEIARLTAMEGRSHYQHLVTENLHHLLFFIFPTTIAPPPENSNPLPYAQTRHHP